MPAKMKGIFDRCFLPGFAFKFENNAFKPLFKQKTARIINIVGSAHPLLLWCLIGSYTNELTKGILKVCGVRSVLVTNFGATRNASEKKIKGWLQRVEKMALQDIS